MPKIFGDLGRDLCLRFKRKVGFSTTQSAVHVQSDFDSKHENFFLRIFTCKNKEKNFFLNVIVRVLNFYCCIRRRSKS
jgi:hypothetical protein